jgi:glycosyltransferase involved in cell wall biosynthesis
MATFDVLLPIKNGIAYFAQSLDSVRGQTFRDWRLFVLDHGSTDGSLELAHAYGETDPRIVVRSFPMAHGLSGLLNCGLELCTGKYVLRQDADDISHPERMAVLAGTLDADDELVLAGSLGDVIDAAGRKIGELDMPTGRHGVIASMPFRTPVAHPTVAMRLEAIQRLDARYGEDFIGAVPAARRIHVPGLAEDYFLFGQLALVGRCVNVERTLVKYRWHGANVGMTRYLDQMRTALRVSRYLVESLSIMRGTPGFDPAPFCNHGMNLFAVDGQFDFSAEYEAMRGSLTRALPSSDELRRELAYRKAISVRTAPLMAGRYTAYALANGVRLTEWRPVRNWLIRGIRKQPILTLTPSGLTA